jgi:hypothetical protein
MVVAVGGGFGVMGVVVCMMFMRLVVMRMVIACVVIVRMTVSGVRLVIGCCRRIAGQRRRSVIRLMRVSNMFGVVMIAMVVVRAVVIVIGDRMIVQVVIVFAVLLMRGLRIVRMVRCVIANLRCIRRRLAIGACALDDFALHPLATVAAPGTAMTRAAAVGAIFRFFLGFAVRSLVRLDQGLTIRNRDLVVIGMDFAESQKAVTIAAIFDERGLERRLYARDLGEIDIAAQLLALGRLEIKFLDAIAADHDHPGFFRMGRIDQHFVGHLGAHDGERHVRRPAHGA